MIQPVKSSAELTDLKKAIRSLSPSLTSRSKYPIGLRKRIAELSRECGNVTEFARELGVPRKYIYDWRKAYSEPTACQMINGPQIIPKSDREFRGFSINFDESGLEISLRTS